jgi:hypothetical protein
MQVELGTPTRKPVGAVRSGRALARKLGERPVVEILHIGDDDPSGQHIFSSLAEDVQALARGLGKTAAFSRKIVAQATQAFLPPWPGKVPSVAR